MHTRLRVQRAPGIPHALKGAKDKRTARAHRAAGRKVVFEVGSLKIESSHVVPAKAGTHTPWPVILGTKAETFGPNERRWLWVPAFAGTTQEDSIVKQQTQLRAPRRDTPELCI